MIDCTGPLADYFGRVCCVFLWGFVLTKCVYILLGILFPLEISAAGQGSMKFFSYSGVIENGTLNFLVEASNKVQASYSPSPYSKINAWSKTGSLTPAKTELLFEMVEQVQREALPSAQETLRPGEATHSFITGVGKTIDSRFSFKLDPLTPQQKALIQAIGAEVRLLK